MLDSVVYIQLTRHSLTHCYCQVHPSLISDEISVTVLVETVVVEVA